MKKILLSLGTLTTIATPIVAVVSCGDDDKAKNTNTRVTTTHTGDGTNNTDGTNNEETHPSIISAAAAKEVGSSLLKDRRIIMGIIANNKTNDFVNTIIHITTEVQKRLGETPAFEDSYTFDYADKASRDTAVNVVYEMFKSFKTSITNRVLTFVLDAIVTKNNINNLLSEELVSVGIAKLFRSTNIAHLLENTLVKNMLTAPNISNLLKGAMPIGALSTGAISMDVEAPTQQHTYPTYKQGTSTNWASLLDLDGGSAPAPTAGGTSTGGTTTAQPTTQPTTQPAAQPISISDDILPLLAPMEKRALFNNDRVNNVLLLLLGGLLTDLGSKESVIGAQTVSGGHVVYGNGLIDVLVESLEMLVPHASIRGNAISKFVEFGKHYNSPLKSTIIANPSSLTNEQYLAAIKTAYSGIDSTKTEAELHTALGSKTTVTATELGISTPADFARDNTNVTYTIDNYSSKHGEIKVTYTLTGTKVPSTGNTGTFILTPKTSAYRLDLSGIINGRLRTTNEATTFAATSMEMVSNVDGSILATKAAGATKFDFKVNELPMIDGVTLNGRPKTTMTIAELVHGTDIKELKSTIAIALQNVNEHAPILSSSLETSHIIATPSAIVTDPAFGLPKYVLGMTSDRVTYNVSLRELPANANAHDKEQYNTALIQMAFDIVGTPEILEKILGGHSGIGDATRFNAMLNPIKELEIAKRHSFEVYMKEMKVFGTTVTVGGHEENVGDAMQVVLDAAKATDFGAWATSLKAPNLFVTTAQKLDDSKVADVTKAIKVLIEASNKGRLILSRIMATRT